MTRAVFATGAPAPEVLDEVTLEGRFGIVLSRLDGPTLLQLSRTGAVTFEQAGVILATLAISVQKTPPPPDVLSLRDYMDGSLRLNGGMLPKHFATGILTLIERLSPGDGLCHCDLHPGNVIMTADGPRLIDWTGTVRAPAALDQYARLAGMSPAALTAAMEPYLPIVCVFVLLGGVPCPAGAADPARRSDAALGGLVTGLRRSQRARCVGIDGAATRRPSRHCPLWGRREPFGSRMSG